MNGSMDDLQDMVQAAGNFVEASTCSTRFVDVLNGLFFFFGVILLSYDNSMSNTETCLENIINVKNTLFVISAFYSNNHLKIWKLLFKIYLIHSKFFHLSCRATAASGSSSQRLASATRWSSKVPSSSPSTNYLIE